MIEGGHGGAVGEGFFGVGMGFEEEGVGAGGEGGFGDGLGLGGIAAGGFALAGGLLGCMGRVNDDGVTQLPHLRDGGDVAYQTIVTEG